MPFIALNQVKQRFISYELSESSYRQPWTCPQCEQPMVLVDCTTRVKHFRHLNWSTCEWEAESSEHLILKKRMFNFFRRRAASCQYEQKIGEGVADLKVVTHEGAVVAVECQVSPIGCEEYEKRSLNYRLAGANPEWILYPKYYLQTARLYSGHPCYRLRKLERLEMGTVLYYNKAIGIPERLWFKPKWAKRGGECSTLHFLKRREPITRICLYDLRDPHELFPLSRDKNVRFEVSRSNLTRFVADIRNVRSQRGN